MQINIISQAYFICDLALFNAIAAITATLVAGQGQLKPQAIDNPAANSTALGYGLDPVFDVINPDPNKWKKWVVIGRTLNDPQLTHYHHLFEGKPTYMFENNMLFLPQPEV
jgi:hypothetical protein